MSHEASSFRSTDKLIALSKTLPARTWISDLRSADSGRLMTFEAVYIPDPGAPEASVAEMWIQKLKRDPAFGRALTRIELEHSSEEKRGENLLYTFRISAQWEGK